MALEYHLYLAADIDPEQALAALVPGVPFARPERRPELVEASLDGVLIVARRRKDDVKPRPVVEEVLDALFPLIVLFRLDKSDSTAWLKMIDVVDRALQRWPDDAALLFNGELVVLHRRQ